MATFSLPRLTLADLPTPVEALPRLTAALGGPQLWIKRDDQTGLAFGGNKARKLELLLADAQTRGARMLLTRGAVQSNHCRQTAAAAARYGFDCRLVLRGDPPPAPNGNLLLDALLGAELIWSGEADPEQVLQESFDQARSDGRRPYLIPYGGSSPLGAAAYAVAMAEVLEQGVRAERIVVASSSGGTQAGLIVGARLSGYPGRILGISVDPPGEALRAQVARLATQTAGLLGQPQAFDPGEVEVDDGYRGRGYGVLGKLERGAIESFARNEGILLDPVYTGRAAGAMLDLIRKGRFDRDERVLFWHTGGGPALFAYAEALTAPAH